MKSSQVPHGPNAFASFIQLSFGFDDLATIYITFHCIFPSEMEYDEDHPVCEKWNQPKNVH